MDKRNKQNNYTVQFTRDSEVFYGYIHLFLKLKDKFFAIIDVFHKENFCFFSKFNNEQVENAANKMDQFFLKVSVINNFEVVLNPQDMLYKDTLIEFVLQ